MIKNIRLDHKEALKKAGEATSKISAEFRKSTATAIITAFGLLAALSWQGTVKVYIDFLVSKLSLSQDPFVYNLYASIFITLVSIIAIMFVSRWAGKTSNNQ